MVYYIQSEGYEANSCSIIESGEIEDYSISITEGNTSAAADFKVDLAAPSLGVPVQFTNNSSAVSSDPIVSYQWTFEEGEPATSNKKDPVVSWTKEGSFDVSLTITTQSGKTFNVEKEDFIVVKYSLCEIKQKWGTKFGHIENLSIGNIDYTTATADIPAYEDLINSHIINVPKSGSIPFSVTLSKGEEGDRGGIGFKIFLDADKNGFSGDEEIFKDWFAAKNTDDLHEFTGTITLPDNYTEGSVVALRVMAYNRGYDGKEWYNPGPCEELDAGMGIDFGIQLSTETALDKNSVGEKYVEVYPNPTSGQLTVNVIDDEIMNLAVYSVSGRKMMEYNNINSSSKELNITQLAKGVYILKLELSESQKLMKVIKK
jgi:hypothetical protein